MENPMTWGHAEWVVHDAMQEYETGRQQGLVGLSEVRYITDALRKAGLIDIKRENSIQ